MKKSTLSKLSKKQYYVGQKCSTYIKKDNIRLCNFYIKSVEVNVLNDNLVSYTICLESEKLEETKTIPVKDISKCSFWLETYFDTDMFKIKVKPISSFNYHLIKILNFFIDNCKVIKFKPGWCKWIDHVGMENCPNRFRLYNSYFEDITHWGEKDKNSLKKEHHYQNLIRMKQLLDNKISIPLIAYTLLSSITSILKYLEKQPAFLMSISGGSSLSRFLLASFYCNLIYRSEYSQRLQFKKYHSYNDTLRVIAEKSRTARDCILIFDEYISKKTLEEICDMYYLIEEKDPTGEKAASTPNGLAMILTEKPLTQKACIINIDITDVSLNPLKNCIIDETVLSNAIYAFVYSIYMKENPTSYIKESFDGFLTEMRQDAEFQALDMQAQVPFAYLLFAFNLYLNLAKEEKAFDDDEYNTLYSEAKQAILELIRENYPLAEDVAASELQQAKKLCDVLDSYFSKSSSVKNIQKIGEEKIDNPEDIIIWFDDEVFLIRLEKLSHILAFQKSKILFKPNIKKALADNELILTHYVADGSRLEYTIHYQKELYKGYKSKNRYVCFNRKKYQQSRLFKNIEERIFEKTNRRVEYIETDLLGNRQYIDL